MLTAMLRMAPTRAKARLRLTPATMLDSRSNVEELERLVTRKVLVFRSCRVVVVMIFSKMIMF